MPNTKGKAKEAGIRLYIFLKWSGRQDYEKELDLGSLLVYFKTCCYALLYIPFYGKEEASSHEGGSRNSSSLKTSAKLSNSVAFTLSMFP